MSTQPRRIIPIMAAMSRLGVEVGEREFLKRLGKYLHTTPQGLAVVKITFVPPIGGNVTDEKGNLVGQIADVFGPINSPYASVKLLEGSAARLNSSQLELFLTERKQSSSRGKYGRH